MKDNKTHYYDPKSNNGEVGDAKTAGFGSRPIQDLLHPPQQLWEEYLNDPEVTAAAEPGTYIYLPVA